jgi:hypothetical protein
MDKNRKIGGGLDYVTLPDLLQEGTKYSYLIGIWNEMYCAISKGNLSTTETLLKKASESIRILSRRL